MKLSEDASEFPGAFWFCNELSFLFVLEIIVKQNPFSHEKLLVFPAFRSCFIHFV